MKTYNRISENFMLKISLREMGFNSINIFKEKYYNKISKIDFFNLIFYCPCGDINSSSHYGIKFNESKINSRTCDQFFDEIMQSLNINSFHFFKVYTSEPNKNGIIKERLDLRESLLNQENEYLYLYTGNNNCHIALFLSIRNALAHGNIFDYNGYTYLYSLSSKNTINIDEFDRNINFIIRIKDINKLCNLFKIYSKYINE